MAVRSSKRVGERGEEESARHLESRGYAVLARNYRTAYGEIDCVAQIEDTIVFVEVKTRRSLRFGTPLEAVTEDKRRRICLSAALYLQENGLMDAPCRFDVMAVRLTGTEASVRHYPSAFDCSDLEPTGPYDSEDRDDSAEDRLFEA